MRLCIEAQGFVASLKDVNSIRFKEKRLMNPEGRA
jgi:hypothetical protein